jgi:diguanylate cyclase (GGDEF)-like protein/PAS domain S-box-containing protein
MPSMSAVASAPRPGPTARRRRVHRLLAAASVLLAGAVTTLAVHVLNAYGDGQRDAARFVVEVEAAAATETVQVSTLLDGTVTLTAARAQVAEVRAGAIGFLASLSAVSAEGAAAVAPTWHRLDDAAVAVLDAQARADSAAAARGLADLKRLNAELATAADAVQQDELSTAGRIDAGAEAGIAVLILASLAAVATATWRAARRRQRVAVVEAESASLRQSEELFRLLFENNPQPLFVFDSATLRILGANQTALDFYGHTRERMLDMTLPDLNDPALREEMAAVMPGISREGSRGRRVRHLLGDGRIVDVEVHSRPVTYEGHAAKLTLVVDVSERTALERELQHQAFHDSLTGLANRALFLDRLEHAMAGRGPASAVLLLDLDGFKTVNDSLGHTAGNDLLSAVAERLVATVRPSDTVARLGGDEFAVILEAVAEPAQADATCVRILQAMAQPFELDGRGVQIGASIGVAVTGGEARDADRVLAEADIAMYVAKANGKGGFKRFSSAMQAELVDRLAMEQDLRLAVGRGELRLLYQPKVESSSGRATAAEALVRWEHPSRGLVPPDSFIPLAEEIGLIAEIDAWVLNTACDQVAAWLAAGQDVDHVAVNISGRELVGGGLVERIVAALERTGIGGRRLEVELTESSAVAQADAALVQLARIRALGVTVAIDDFGTGYSMLSRLQDFPADRLKIDKSFIDEIDVRVGAPLVTAMIGMAHELGLEVVAEGVETADQLTFLRASGIDQLQGYLLSRPVEAERMEAMLGRVVDPANWTSDAALETAMQTAADVAAGQPDHDRLVHILLAELERLTGLESTYVTRFHDAEGTQEILAARNTGGLQIPVGLAVPLEHTLCKRTMDDGRSWVRSVSETYPDSGAARQLGIETFATVPMRDASGRMVGTLCGASRQRRDLSDSVIAVMELFARLMAEAAVTELQPA